MTYNNRRKIIGVIGGSACSEEIYDLAFEVGKLLAKRNFTLICGGFGGVMEAASKGAKSANGLTIGIIPSNDPEDANPYIDVPIVTGMGIGRNIIIVRSSDALIAIDGKYGTLSEIAYACQLEKKIIGLNTWDIPDITPAENAEDAVNKVTEYFR